MKIKGFTLLELLVAIAIIAILTSISLVALGGAREQARDGRRKADLEAIRSALELYKADCNQYPDPASFPSVGNPLTGTCGGGTNTYLQKRPGDPSGTSFGVYAYSPVLTAGAYRSYTLCSALEDPPSSPDITNCGSCGSSSGCSYKVTNP